MVDGATSPQRGVLYHEAMGQTFVAMYSHIIFSTKHRTPLIARSWRDALYAYMAGVSQGLGCTQLAIGGIEDHVHLLISMKPTVCLSELVRDVKAASSRWVHETRDGGNAFEWQRGYAAFSVSTSNMEGVKTYLASQVEHHRIRTFKEELLEFLERHQIPYDDRYIWD